MAPHRFDDTGAQLTAELVDHAGDSRPTCVIGVRGNSLVDLAGGEHLPWPAGQQEQNVERAKEQRGICGGGHCGEVRNRSKSRHSVCKDGVLVVAEG